MRTTLFATAAFLSLALGTAAQAQSADTSAPPPAAAAPDGAAHTPHMTHRHRNLSATGDETFAHEPGTGESGPASSKASNVDEASSHSAIAPHFPAPLAGHDASADAYLGAAQRALKANRTGEAQQALEMAETRLLDRSTPADAAGQPMQNPQIQQIGMARQALGHGDRKGAASAITMALATNAGSAR